ncbi:class I SAM-dependent methyltransferase [Leptothoe kymatousa]|uniref:Class I SAM-dependent methyltransferase n=1 Tax=Leptothoe kymatousa TAU-MAC 1615 TaxID=2364775 RepID=A0ABS5XYW6_9CYAN|nr:class I SAM-dependent methyltransferase [Leptothoe kymatousa]MBT9310817.1 class I SAM-dependent methyltransferase [Leptothoe kymatousa TAU-MAC 1615]
MNNAIATRSITGLINRALAIKPLANFAKDRARNMMIKRAESIGVYWLDEVAKLRSRGGNGALNPLWEQERAAICDRTLTYPDYYLTSFHAYEEGNLGWEPALEATVAAKAVHARLWPEGDARGDVRLRQSYLDALAERLPTAPESIVDLGCSTGLSTCALQSAYPHAHITGVELSDYFLTVAQYQTRASAAAPQWRHAAAEQTGLSGQSVDLVSASLLFHELPTSAALDVIREAHRLLKPGGHFAIMEMNPQSEVYKKLPAYVLTLLKSTEPYLDQYFSLDLHQALMDAGFNQPSQQINTSRHRVVIAQKTGAAS